MLPSTRQGLSLEHTAIFRQATSDDIPAMSRIRLSVRENVLSDPARITDQMYLAYLSVAGRGWVAESNGQIVGFCYADREGSSIWALFLYPEHEGRGIAKRLLNLAVDWLFELGHDCIELSTGVGTRADRFYAAQGWTRAEVERDKSVRYILHKAAAPTIVAAPSNATVG